MTTPNTKKRLLAGMNSMMEFLDTLIAELEEEKTVEDVWDDKEEQEETDEEDIEEYLDASPEEIEEAINLVANLALYAPERLEDFVCSTHVVEYEFDCNCEVKSNAIVSLQMFMD